MFAVFTLFGVSHIAALLCIAALTAFAVWACRKDAKSKTAKTCIGLLAFLCFSIYPLQQIFHTVVGGVVKVEDIYPFHLCDIAAVICGFALITRKPALCELAYFWGLAGTLQGLLTPDLNHDFPNPVFLIFFTIHGAIVATALLLPLGLGWKPRPKATLRVFIWVLVYTAGALIINAIMGSNFGFLTHKPENASLLDIMGPWPWYILVLLLMAGLIFWLLSWPFKRFNQGKSTASELN